MDWDDLRFFDALAQSGTVRGAAGELGVNPSTVTRRLDQLEESLGVTLFRRTQQGLHITTEGVELTHHAEEIAGQFKRLEIALKGRDQRLEGRIRLAVPDVLATHFLLQDLAPFTEMYPHIDLHILPGYQNLNLSRNEADVVIRATDTPPDSMVGRSLSPVALAAYGSRGYVAEHGADYDTTGLAWVDWAASGEVMNRYSALRELYFPDVKIHIRCDQIEMHRAALGAGMGLGILPCLVGDAQAELQRLPQMPVQQGPALWLLTHPDQRSVRRVQVLLAFLREIFTNRQADLAGAEK